MPVDLDDVENLMEFTVEPKLYEKETELLVKGLICIFYVFCVYMCILICISKGIKPGFSFPSNPEKAFNTFIKLTALLKSIGNETNVYM